MSFLTSFLFYDLCFLIIFSLSIFIFLYKRKKKIEREGILYIYRTKIGIKLIDYIGKKCKKTLDILQYISISIGYLLMVGMLFLLSRVIYTYLKFPEITRVLKAPPLMPLIPYFPRIFGVQRFFPPFYFTYFIISILIVASVHEFSHGIFAKSKKLKIKSTGFAFLGPLMGAFVEPDEKQMTKKSKLDQMAILSAGVFANIITAILFIFITWLFLALAFTQTGAVFNNYAVTQINISSITSIGNHRIENSSNSDILELIENKEIENEFVIPLNGESINLTEIKVDGKKHFIDLESLGTQLKTEKNILNVYGDFPAIKAGLKGIIIEFSNVKIKNQKDLTQEINKHNPFDNVTIKTKFENSVLSYHLQLSESPIDKNKAFLGISSMSFNRLSFRSIAYRFLNFFEDPSTALEPKFNSNLIIFIKNLLWWIILINILVALFNMLPLGIFDGGRVFYLTALAVLKKERKARLVFKIITFLIIFLFILLMMIWLGTSFT